MVLVVDDDEAMCRYLAAFLQKRGYAPVTADNGEHAVERFQAKRPAAVILDLIMPGGMDGLAALAAMKKIDRDVSIVVVSAQGRTNTVVQAMKLGAADFVSKPFEDVELEGPLANAIRQYEVGREVASIREELGAHSKHSMLFGKSDRMLEVRELIAAAGPRWVSAQRPFFSLLQRQFLTLLGRHAMPASAWAPVLAQPERPDSAEPSAPIF